MAHAQHKLDDSAWVEAVAAGATSALGSVTAGAVRAKVAASQPAATVYDGHLFVAGQAFTRETFPTGAVWVRGRAVLDVESV